ncbi:uncharacterized protein FOMMEDRAFT_165017 [Fomitiporia mediterranea MF3/22]|uniref:uncharacterized protein n=1 Tax=Fomitiporia mediterranea (strain MF3/22) TaxID=694068 RepID=UPI00044093C5|nr:uncharacterized protein FOMMEDRAFT_165017 [Fomitiporia mediterranea MF3/22]EJD08430.1 hypothetical protein FOMMEDRAFT_165017 [Fomitiporia mediterranea MF3/22]
MASLLDRIDVAQPNGTVGPVRNRGTRSSSVPYDKSARLGRSKADADAVWKHDLYTGPGKTLGSRISDDVSTTTTAKVNTSGAALALRQAIGLDSRRSSGADLNIRGASAVGSNVVQVKNLAAGTTAADVEAIFKKCGPILEAYTFGSYTTSKDKVTVRLKFKNSEDAKTAVSSFNGKPADGNVLAVDIVGSASTALGGRLLGGSGVVVDGTVDVLMDDVAGSSSSGGSKMRSDELLNDPRAQVLIVPPGVDPAEYNQSQRGGSWRGRGGRGRGGGRRPGRGSGRRMQRTGSSMLVD